MEQKEIVAELIPELNEKITGEFGQLGNILRELPDCPKSVTLCIEAT